MHAKPDLRAELEPNGHFFRLGDLGRYPMDPFEQTVEVAAGGCATNVPAKRRSPKRCMKYELAPKIIAG